MLKAYMITIEGREESADFTASEFEQHGIEVIRFVQPLDIGVGQKGNNWNSQRVIKAATDAGEDFLFIEDDLFMNHERFARCVRDLQEDPELTYLYIHESRKDMDGVYPREDATGPMKRLDHIFNFHRKDWRERSGDVVIREGFRTLLNHRVFGSQCVFIPARYLPAIYDTHNKKYSYSANVFSQNERPFDDTLTDVVLHQGIPARTWLPHPVQHKQNRIHRSHRRSNVYSRSFHATSDVEWAEKATR